MSSDGLMDGMDNALTGAITDVTDNVWTVGLFTGFHAGNFFSPLLPGNSDRYSADGDRVTDELPE